ncbi:MAG: ATP synthase F1 subunit gamma [Deltaproteobacteria bacterium]|nr:ATP synthase F1 subunit gamma [Deltaproteobacteria bacterium]
MATLSDIKRRIKSVKNTRQITKAMKMVSAAKLRKAQEAIVAARPYAEKVRDLVDAISKKSLPHSHPLLSKQNANSGAIEIVLITSDRGLCGSFNTVLIRTTERLIRENKGKKIGLHVVGRRAVDHFKNRKDIELLNRRNFGSGRPTMKTAADIAVDITGGYMKDRCDEAYIVYSEFQSAMTQRPVAQKVLPVLEKGAEAPYEGYIYEPSPEAVLDELLPKYIEVQIFRGLLESSASEHGARMTAMDSASRNASDMISGLTLLYNRARQAAITKELMEIIGGAEALKG